MLKRIGAEESGEFKAVASGTLPSGKPVVVNADGTVSVISASDASVGSAAVFESASTGKTATTFDSSNNKIVISYRDVGNSYYGTAVVGTVSGSSISFGTPVVFNSASTNDEAGITFDSNSNKVVVIYSTSSQGTAKVGTVSGTSISFGSATVFDASQGVYIGVTFDSNSNKVVVVYTGTNNYVESRVGTISGTSISFGTAVVAKSSSTDGNAITFDSNRNKIVIVSRISTNAQAMVGTVSGTDISFASSVGIGTQTKFLALTFDSSNNKVITAFVDGSVSDQGKVIVGDIDGSGVISFGTAVEYNANIDEQQGVAFDSNANKVIIAYDSAGTSKGQVISGTVSGTSISFDSETVFEAANVEGVSVAFDSNANKNVISYIDGDNSRYGTSAVFAPASTTLTSENYIGMSRGVAGTATQSEAVGSPTSIGFAGEPSTLTAAYDSSTGKVAISCKDGGNSNYGTTIIGTVSGTSISFGSPVVFNSETTNSTINVFDSSNNKIVTLYRNSSGHPHAKVGTISGTSISYGSAVQILGSSSGIFGATFDSTNNKVVMAYGGITVAKATAVVGTVSGTSISFGSAVTTESSYIGAMGFDSTNGKVVFALYTASNGGRAYVGTVSGTSISFGSAVQFNSNIGDLAGVAHDPNSGKTVIGYRKGGGEAAAIVGTVSGTSISFGSETEVQTSNTTNVGMGFDSRVNKVIYAYRYGPSPYSGRLRVGTVSGTSISFDSEVTFESGTTSNLQPTSIAFDTTEGVSVISYKDEGDSNTAKVTVFQASGSFVNRAEVASGQAASVDIIGSVSDNQSGLTAGQQYFVQTDGTIGTTAATPSVLAGTAISATELVVKT